jgi:hypothetical protein
VEHELSGPEATGDDQPVVTAPEIVMAGPDDLPGGLYDDATGLADDATDLDDDATAELDIDGSLLDTIEQELADVERALALLDEGTYGQCEHCGGAIDDELLVTSPTTRLCAEHLPLSLR